MKGLIAYNVKAVGKIDYRPLTLTVNDKRAIVGGLVGETYFGWMFASLFWVSEKYRGKGWGKSLMESAEKEARKRGVRQVYLDTFSFQARGFYERLGYRAFGQIDDYPPGETRFFLSKRID